MNESMQLKILGGRGSISGHMIVLQPGNSIVLP
jgi:hypothetical protein